MNADDAVNRLVEVIRLRHLAKATEDCYAGWLRRFARFLCDRKPAGTTEQKLEAFLSQLASQDVAASTQNQAFNALVFFYREALGQPLGDIKALRAKRPATLRSAPSVDEVRSLLDGVKDVGGYPTGLIVRMLYGMGLRVSEPLNLRVKDVLLAESRLLICGAKGGKDRMVALPCAVVPELKAQLTHARAVWERDRLAGIPVALPGLLARKYPQWATAWKWAWVFPARSVCRHPRNGETVRWRCHEANVQRAVRQAAGPLGLCVTPHHLRHAFATHLLERRVNPRAIQEAMGHASLETTMGYLHAEALSVPSPLDPVVLMGV
jgi:integron integrase